MQFTFVAKHLNELSSNLLDCPSVITLKDDFPKVEWTASCTLFFPLHVRLVTHWRNMCNSDH